MKSILALFTLALISTSAMADVVTIGLNKPREILPSCGGTVTASKDSTGQITINLKNVVDCSNFDILDSNYSSVNYPNQKLDGPKRNMSSHFPVPRYLVDAGQNSIVFSVKSNNFGKPGKEKAHGDFVVLQFFQKPAKPQAPVIIITPPPARPAPAPQPTRVVVVHDDGGA